MWPVGALDKHVNVTGISEKSHFLFLYRLYERALFYDSWNRFLPVEQLWNKSKDYLCHSAPKEHPTSDKEGTLQIRTLHPAKP